MIELKSFQKFIRYFQEKMKDGWGRMALIKFGCPIFRGWPRSNHDKSGCPIFATVSSSLRWAFVRKREPSR